MWREVELRELRVFLVLADELHFGRTAQADRVDPVASQPKPAGPGEQARRRLVRRTSRRVELTPAGEQFRDHVDPALGRLEDVLEATEKAGTRITGPVRLGVVSAAMIGPAVNRIIEAYQAAHPDSAVELIGLPFRDRFGPIRRGEVDAMVVSLPLDEPDLSTGRVLSRDPRMLAVGRRHPLAQRDEVSVEDLTDYAVHRLARHPHLRRHLRHRQAIGDHRQHSLIPLLHHAQLPHGNERQPSVKSRYPLDTVPPVAG